MMECPICPFSGSSEYELSLHFEETHFSDDSPFVAKDAAKPHPDGDLALAQSLQQEEAIQMNQIETDKSGKVILHVLAVPTDKQVDTMMTMSTFLVRKTVVVNGASSLNSSFISIYILLRASSPTSKANYSLPTCMIYILSTPQPAHALVALYTLVPPSEKHSLVLHSLTKQWSTSLFQHCQRLYCLRSQWPPHARSFVKKTRR